MQIMITASSNEGLKAMVDTRFARAPYFAIVDSEKMEVEFLDNNATTAASGAGIVAAQAVADRGVDTVISGNFGPKAFSALRAGNLKLYSFTGGTIKEAVEAFKKGELKEINNSTSDAHYGLR
jgi:predicted Fe-Mo cluster-binding NifX family protein